MYFTGCKQAVKITQHGFVLAAFLLKIKSTVQHGRTLRRSYLSERQKPSWRSTFSKMYCCVTSLIWLTSQPAVQQYIHIGPGKAQRSFLHLWVCWHSWLIVPLTCLLERLFCIQTSIWNREISAQLYVLYILLHFCPQVLPVLHT